VCPENGGQCRERGLVSSHRYSPAVHPRQLTSAPLRSLTCQGGSAGVNKLI
jgi:hypothetical protein